MTVDRRDEQSPVKDQGARPTCAAFAVSAAHEWVGDHSALSEEMALYATHRDRDRQTEAAYVPDVLTAIGDGQTSSEAWPYGRPHWSIGTPAGFDHAQRHYPGKWTALPATFDAVAEALADATPILTVRVVDRVWTEAAGTGHVVNDASRPVVDAHAVLAVGSLMDASRWLIIKNSWGTAWGDGGYGYLSGDYIDQHLVAVHRMERT